MLDAEGRLTLADALVFAEAQVGAEVVIDLATLTGASMVALGENIGSLFASGSVLQDVSNAASCYCDAYLFNNNETNIQYYIITLSNY